MLRQEGVDMKRFTVSLDDKLGNWISQEAASQGRSKANTIAFFLRDYRRLLARKVVREELPELYPASSSS